MDIKDFRSSFPEYDDYSDDEVVTALQQTSYKDYTEQEVAEGLGVHSSKFIDYTTPETDPQERITKPEPASEDAQLSKKMGDFFNSSEYKVATYGTQDPHREKIQGSKEELTEQFFAENIANRIPAPYREEYKNHFLDTIRAAENKYTTERMSQMQKQFREADPAYTNWFNRTGQSILRGLDYMFTGMEVIERKAGLVPEDYYDNLREGGWQDFGERYVRQKQYQNTGLFDEIVQTIAEFSVPMVAGGMATIALGPAAPAAASTGLVLGVTSLTAIASETGSKRKQIDDDPRFNKFTPDEKDNIAAQYGLYSGMVEGVGSLIGIKILKGAGSGLIKALSKTPASKGAIKSTGKLLSKIQSAGDTKVGQYLKLVMAPVASGTTEMTEELLQTHISEAIDFFYLTDNKDAGIKDLSQQFINQWNDPKFQAELAHTAKVSFGAGVLPVGAVNTMRAVTKAKAQMFTGAKSTPDIESAVDDILKRADADIEALSKDPKSDPEALDELIKLREVIKKTAEAKESGLGVNAETIEQEAEAEAERYKKLLEDDDEVQPETDRRVHPVDPGGAEYTESERRGQKRKEADAIGGKKDRRQDIERAKATQKVAELRKIKVDAIKQMDKPQAQELVKMYEGLKELNALDKARLIRAKARVKFHERQDAKSKAFKKAMKPAAKAAPKPKAGVLYDARGKVQPNVVVTHAVDYDNDPRPKRFSKSGLATPTGQKLNDDAKLKGGVVFSREDDYVDTKGTPLPDDIETAPENDYWKNYNRAILDNIESKIATGKWRFQELFDRVVSNSPDFSVTITDRSPRMVPGAKVRGNHTVQFDGKTGAIKLQQIVISPQHTQQMYGDKISGIEVVLIHELIHAMHSQYIGPASWKTGKAFFKEISDAWRAIPKEWMDMIDFWADEYISRHDGAESEMIWDAYTEEQRSKAESWATLRHVLRGAKADSNIWDEVMAMAFSDPGVMADLYTIPSVVNGKKTGESVGRRLLRAFLDFVNGLLPKGTKMSDSFMDDLLSIHEKYAGHVASESAVESLNSDMRESLNALKGLSDADRALLKARAEERGGTPLSAWAKVRKPNQRALATVKRRKREATRWDLDRASDRLVSMKESTLDAELDKVQDIIKEMKDAGKTINDPRMRYYKERESAIVVIQEARNIDRIKKQRAKFQEMTRKAGDTKLAQIRWYKPEYKRMIRRDAPHSDVMRVRAKLIDLMGPNFYTWSKEPMPSAIVKAQETRDNAPIQMSVTKPTPTYSGVQIDDAIKEAGLEPGTKYREVDIDPKTYLELTTGSDTRKDAIKSKSPNVYKQAEMDKSGAPLLVIDANGVVTAHDGRHRAATHMKTGRNVMPILLLDNIYPTKIKAQKFGSKQRSTTFVPQPKTTVVSPSTPKTQAKEQKGVVGLEARAVAPSAKEAKAKFDAIMNHLRENYLTQGRAVNKNTADKIIDIMTQADEYGAITQDELRQAQEDLAMAMELGSESLSSRSLGVNDPIQRQLDKVMPVKVRFDAYHSKDEGYIPSGYMFTIMDRNHPAYKSTFQVDDLDAKTIASKFKTIEKLYADVKENLQSLTWETHEDSTSRITESSTPIEGGHKVIVTVDSFPQFYDANIFDGLQNDQKLTLKAGLPKTSVEWEYQDPKGKTYYARDLTQEGGDKPKLNRSINELGIGAIRHVQRLLTDIVNGERKHRKPAVIHFSAFADDVGKVKAYTNFIHRVGRKLGWRVAIEGGTDFYAINENYEITEEDKALLEERKARVEGTGSDKPIYDPVIRAQNSIETAFNALEPSMYIDTDGALYHHSDGGNYFDLKIRHYPEDRQLLVIGTHEHYGEETVLFDVRLTDDNVENGMLLDDVEMDLKEGLIAEDFTQGAFDASAIEQELASREDIDPGDVLEHLDSIVTPHEFKDPKMEKDATIAEGGIKEASWWSKSLSWLKQVRELAREFEPLKRKEYSDVQLALRNLKKGKEQSAQLAVDILNNTLKSLSKDQFHNLQRLAYMMDLREQVIVNQEKAKRGADPDTLVDNPNNWDDDKILAEAEEVYKLVRADDATYQAWRTRQNAWYEIRSLYKDAMEGVGFDAARRLNRIYYFRHQVLDVLQAEQKFYGIQGSNKLVVPTSRSYLRKRTGAKGKPINFNYIQAEFEVMAQMVYDTQIANTLSDIMEKYGSKDRQEGYTLYRPREESIFYMANTVPGRLVNSATEKGMKELKVPLNRVKQAMAFGGKYKGYYLPDKIAQTLENALAERPYGPVMRSLRKALTAWKVYQLLSPLRAVKYNVRNLTGDAEAVFIGSPEVFTWIPKAVGDLYNWRVSGKAPKDLQAWLDRGGMQSTLQSLEMVRIIEAPEFRKQMGKSAITANPIAWGKKWFSMMRAGTDMREAMLRYAAFKKFKSEIQASGKPKSYVASLPEEVDVLSDVDDKAFMMANDLLGAYDRISVGGENLRRFWMPFWSFQEVNVKRSLAMWRNAINDDTAVAQVGRRLGAKTPIIALKVGVLALKFMAFSAAVQGWNEWMFGDEEDALPEEMRQRSHIILGKSKGPNGKVNVVYFPRIGVVGDLLEWIGFESAPSDARDIYEIATGQKTWDQKTEEIGKVFGKYDYGAENVKRVINKLAQSIGPQYKMPLELLMREKFFPSVFNRQPITSTGRYLVEQTGFQAIYDQVAGRPQRKDWVKRMGKSTIAYEEDKARLGWLAIQQRIVEYQRQAGLKGKGFIVTETGSALYNMGLAWRYGDEEALSKYFLEYVTLSVNKLSTGTNFNNAMRNNWEKLNPLAALPDIHAKLFYASLDERGLKQFNLALQYYAEMAGGVQFLED